MIKWAKKLIRYIEIIKNYKIRPKFSFKLDFFMVPSIVVTVLKSRVPK
jgi:hypothetical protein